MINESIFGLHEQDNGIRKTLFESFKNKFVPSLDEYDYETDKSTIVTHGFCGRIDGVIIIEAKSDY